MWLVGQKILKVSWKAISEISGNSKYDRNIGESLTSSIASNGDRIKANYTNDYFKNTKCEKTSNIQIIIRFGHV